MDIRSDRLASACVNSPRSEFNFVLIPGFSLLSLAAFTEPLRCINAFLNKDRYSWHLLSETGREVTSSIGSRVAVDGGLELASAKSAIVVVGANAGLVAASERLSRWLCRMGRFGALMASAGNASYILASAGLLNGHRVAVHRAYIESFMERFPNVDARCGLYEIDRNRLSCAGESACLDAIVCFLTASESDDVITALCASLLQNRIRHSTDCQSFRTARNIHLRQALEIMESEMEEPLCIEGIARRIGRSRRQLERLFHRHLRRSPVAYHRDMRLDKARDLILNTTMRTISISTACGFASQQSFSRAYRARFGHSPCDERGIVRPQSTAPSTRSVSLEA